jgi:hypothetical protein
VIQYGEQIQQELLLTLADAFYDSAVLKLFAGPVPASCSDPDPDHCLCSIPLPETPFRKVNDSKLESEVWLGAGNSESGGGRLCRSFRLFGRDGSVICQGSAGAYEDSVSGQPVDLRLGNPAIASGREVKIRFKFDLAADVTAAPLLVE